MEGTRNTKTKEQWWFLNYDRRFFRPDLIAGLTASAVVIPKAMAFALVAGLPVELGLYTAFIPMVVYALLGTSRPLSVSTTTAIAILTAGALSDAGAGAGSGELMTAASTLAFLVGAFLLLGSLLKLGFIANFISAPVLTGFKAGIGLVIVVDQIPKLLGVHIEKGSFHQNVLSIVQHFPETDVWTLVLGIATLVLLAGLERFRPHSPAPLVAVALGIGASALIGLKALGVELVGAIPPGLPSLHLPDLSLVGKLWPGALGIAVMSFTESIAAGRGFLRHGDPPANADRELFALGAANLAGCFFRILPAGGGTSQTAVNSKSGARTQMAELVTAMITLATLLFLAPLVSLLPKATLAAVIIITTAVLLNPVDFRAILRIRRLEFWWAVIALGGVVLLGTLEGILVAVVLSLLGLIYQANHPPVYALARKPGTDIFRPRSEEHPDDETFPGLLLVRTEGRMTFASAPRVGEKLLPLIYQDEPKVVALDCSAVPDFEYTALTLLTDFEEKLRGAGIELWLVALNPKPLGMIRHAPLGEVLGTERMFFNLEQAVERYLKRS